VVVEVETHIQIHLEEQQVVVVQVVEQIVPHIPLEMLLMPNQDLRLNLVKPIRVRQEQ
tara:strand:+ start:196 stop:369 length:174 start_codon:yes stop_codon:yes gene_type:complete